MNGIGHKRGARNSPRHKLLASHPFIQLRAPLANFAVIPKQLSYWDNDQDGDCVTAEEAYAKAAYSVMAGLPELFVTDEEVINWARAHGVLNGATLTEVLDAMKVDPFIVADKSYLNGPYTGVDYSKPDVLKSAIEQGPVKIAIDADALPSNAGGTNGWYAITSGPWSNTDHCVSLTGHGTAAYLYQALGLAVPQGVDPATPGFLLFTWKSIGFVSHDWIMGTCTEAWVRNPTTVGQQPIPPGPTPTPTPTPTPSPFPPILTILHVLCALVPLLPDGQWKTTLKSLCAIIGHPNGGCGNASGQ